MNQQLQQLQNENNNLQQKKYQLEKLIQEITEQISHRKNDIQLLTNQCDEMKNEINELKQQYQSFQNKMKKKTDTSISKKKHIESSPKPIENDYELKKK